MHLFTILLILLIFPALCSAFANMLIKDCDKEIEIGVEMMGIPVEFNEQEKRINVLTMGGNSISNGTIIEKDSAFVVKLHPSTNQCILEVRGDATFEGGGCLNKRILCGGSRGAIIHVAAKSEVQIVAAWALSFQTGVQHSAPFVFDVSKHTEL